MARILKNNHKGKVELDALIGWINPGKIIEGITYDINKLKKTQSYTYSEIVESIKRDIIDLKHFLG